MKNSRIARTIATITFTLATVQLWSLAVNAADTRTEVRKNADGSVTTCEYKTAFARINGESVIHKTWRCETVKGAK